MEAHTLLALPLVLALEPLDGERPPLNLSRDAAAALAARVADDLHALLPQVRETRLALAGALFDPVELLRPGFPAWTTLEDLARRVPRGQLDNVVAFGCHEARMPAPALQPSVEFADGPLRLLPLCLLAPAALAAELAGQLEIQLIGRGEAGVPTADWLMRALGIRLQHVRYLSRNDLLALTCVQYENVNLAPLWSLLEAALLSPDRAESALSARGLALEYAHGQVQAQSPAQWLAAQAPGDVAQRVHDYAGIVFELRQYAALLDAHQLPLRLQPGSAQATEAAHGYLLETVAAAQAGGATPVLLAHEARGLGVVTVSVVQQVAGRRARVLAHGYPLAPAALGPLLTQLAERYGVAAELHALGRVVLDERGTLGAPDAILD